MLLIDDGEPEILKLYRVLDDRVCTDDHLDFAR
jgi:hypothetical protein